MKKPNVHLINFLLLTFTCLANSHGTHQRSHMLHRGTRSLLLDTITDNELKDTPQGTSNHRDICRESLSKCVPFVQCPAHVDMDSIERCRTLGGHSGICCTTGQNHTGPLNEKTRGYRPVSLDPVTLGAVSRHSKAELAELRSREARLLSSGNHAILFPGSASYTHSRNSRTFNIADLTEVMGLATDALQITIATKAFKDRRGLTNTDLQYNMVKDDLRPTPLGEACASVPLCSEIYERYRRIDGACNHLRHHGWGSSLTPYARLLPPSYEDGIWSPRTSVYGQQLTSPRLISTHVMVDNDIPNDYYTLMLMQYGQFISHEITQSIDFSYGNGSAIACCSPDGDRELPPHLRHYACMPVPIPEDDYFYSIFGQKCMNFVRSMIAPRQDCTLGYAQQMNKVTHFIDGSSVYGSAPEQTSELRSFEDGLLRVFNDYGRELLPLSKDPSACLTMEEGSACFTSGDTRTNQMASLVVMHILFMREHNRIARELQKYNPHWQDEKLFLEARHILTAELQVITYKEFLPALIGDYAMEEFELNLQEEDYSVDYDETIEPSVTNEFASAAFRFGHSTVDGLLKVYGPWKVEEIIAIPEIMFHPSRLRKRQFLDEILSTLTTEPLQEVDNSLSEALTKYMFRAGNPYGVDLASINIQRGRDHGLRSYNDYRELVGLPRIRSFGAFGPELQDKLAMVYESVDDIDLWVGGLLENKAPGSVIGPTFRDIIADQFARLKRGDRYFFDLNPNINPGHFTLGQLYELRKVSMSRIICDNSDGILLARQARNAFMKPGIPGNEFYECSGEDIPRVDLSEWKEMY